MWNFFNKVSSVVFMVVYTVGEPVPLLEMLICKPQCGSVMWAQQKCYLVFLF